MSSPVGRPLLTHSEYDAEADQQQWVAGPEHVRSLVQSAPDAPEIASALKEVALGHSWSGTREAAFAALQQINLEAASEIASRYYKRLAELKEKERQH